jgi:glutamyl-tRNA reductase
MVFCVAGVNYKTAPIEIREKLSFSEEEIKEAFHLLLAKEEVEECVILSTCNRVEIYALLSNDRVNILRDFIRDFHKFNGDLDRILYCKKSESALKHLCIVAAGLDSMILGEPQIFGQVKDAYTKAVECNGVAHALEHLFSQVFGIVKRVRSKTGIGEKCVSVSYAAVRLAQTIFESLNNVKVMILGAGEMGELTVRNLISSGVNEVVVANRTFQKAVELSEKFKGTPVMLHEIKEYMPQSDIIISSISIESFILKKEEISEILNLRNGKPLFIVDIAVPRSIDPLIRQLQGVHLYNIDDLKAVADSNAEARKREAQRGIEIIESRIPQMMEYMKSYDFIPTLVSIRNKAEEIRRDGIEKVIESMPVLNQERETIEMMTKTIVNRILHHSEVKLREYTSNLKSA